MSILQGVGADSTCDEPSDGAQRASSKLMSQKRTASSADQCRTEPSFSFCSARALVSVVVLLVVVAVGWCALTVAWLIVPGAQRRRRIALVLLLMVRVGGVTACVIVLRIRCYLVVVAGHGRVGIVVGILLVGVVTLRIRCLLVLVGLVMVLWLLILDPVNSASCTQRNSLYLCLLVVVLSAVRILRRVALRWGCSILSLLVVGMLRWLLVMATTIVVLLTGHDAQLKVDRSKERMQRWVVYAEVVRRLQARFGVL